MSSGASKLAILVGVVGLCGAGVYVVPRYLQSRQQQQERVDRLRQMHGYVEAARGRLGRSDLAGGLVQLDLAYQTGVADDGIRFMLPQLAARLQAHVATFAHEGEVSAVAFSPSGLQALTGSADHNVRIWDAGSGSLVHKLSGHDGPVSYTHLTLPTICSV